MDGVERLIQLLRSRADTRRLVQLDELLESGGGHDRRIVPFLLRVLEDRDEAVELRLEVVKALTNLALAADERPAVAQAIARVLAAGGAGRLRQQAAIALGCFPRVEGVAAALGSVAVDPIESVDLRFSAFASLEAAGATPESVRVVHRLTLDETLGPSARVLLATWRIEA